MTRRGDGAAAPGAFEPAGSRRALRRAAGLGGALLLILLALGAGVLSIGGPGAMAEGLARTRPGWVFAALAAMVSALLLSGPRLCALLPDGDWRRPPPLAAGTLMLASTLLNLSFPGPAGELAAAAAAQRTWGVPAPTALAASLHGRLSGLAAGGLLALLALPLLPAQPDLHAPLLLVGGGLGVAGVAVGGLSLRPGWLGAAAQAGPAALAERLPGPAGALMARVAGVLSRAADQLSAGLTPSPGRWLRALGWSALSHLIFTAAVLSSAAAVGVEIPPAPALAAHAASVVASVALVILPGGAGAWDASFGGVLIASAGLSLEQAALVLLAVRVVQVLGLFAAAAAFLGWSRRLMDARSAPG